MVVIIPHQTEELKLIKFQKMLIASLNSKNVIFYRQTPLWIELPFANFTTKEELKSFSKQIKAVNFQTLQYTDNTLIISGTLLTNEKTYELHLPIIKKISTAGDYTTPEDSTSTETTNKKSPVENLKIFQLGIVNNISKSTFELSETTWVKCPPERSGGIQ